MGVECAEIRERQKGALVTQRDESVFHPVAERVHGSDGNQWSKAGDRIGSIGRSIGVGPGSRWVPPRCHSNPYDGDRRAGIAHQPLCDLANPFAADPPCCAVADDGTDQKTNPLGAVSDRSCNRYVSSRGCRMGHASHRSQRVMDAG